jgi:hypothetical protein
VVHSPDPHALCSVATTARPPPAANAGHGQQELLVTWTARHGNCGACCLLPACRASPSCRSDPCLAAASLSLLVCGTVYILGAVTCIGFIKNGKAGRPSPVCTVCAAARVPSGVALARAGPVTAALTIHFAPTNTHAPLAPACRTQPSSARSSTCFEPQRSWIAWRGARRIWSGSWAGSRWLDREAASCCNAACAASNPAVAAVANTAGVLA